MFKYDVLLEAVSMVNFRFIGVLLILSGTPTFTSDQFLNVIPVLRAFLLQTWRDELPWGTSFCLENMLLFHWSRHNRRAAYARWSERTVAHDRIISLTNSVCWYISYQFSFDCVPVDIPHRTPALSHLRLGLHHRGSSYLGLLVPVDIEVQKWVLPGTFTHRRQITMSLEFSSSLHQRWHAR